MPVRRIKLTVEYDGTNYHGWQIQNNVSTVQGEIEKAVYKITGEKTRVVGAGRTDKGVHALAQAAHFDTGSKIPADKFARALNTALPEDIAVISSEEVTPDFHSRFSSTGKTYEYRILNREIRSPIMAKRAWHIRGILDIKSMEQAASFFVGEHDFESFCASGHSVQTTVRTVFSSEWTNDGDCLIYRISGNGFLYNMVRIITGTLIEVGLKKRTAESIPLLLNSRDRNLAGITAPPQGLYLVKVHYPNYYRN